MDELAAELRSFLDQRRCAVLATHDSGGTIHLTPIWFLFEGGCFYFESSSTSRKVRNLAERPSATVVVDARDPGRERWVSASGPVEIVRDAESASINSRIRRRYLAEPALDSPLEAALAVADDVTLKLVPAAWQSWAAPAMESPERLFLPAEP